MVIPSFQQAKQSAETAFVTTPIAAGVQTFVLKSLEASKTKSTEKDMMIATLVVDSGLDTGRTHKEFLVDDFGFQKLASICGAGGFQWQTVEGMTLQRFVSQFDKVYGRLRFQARVYHKQDSFNGESRTVAAISYGEVESASTPSELPIAQPQPQQFQQPQQQFQQPTMQQQFQQAQPAFQDDLPF